MCCGPYDFDYPTYGGIHPRSNPTYGRVGSTFSDPNAGYGPSADSNLEPHPESETDLGLDEEPLEGDDDLDRADEDLDDDLEGLDEDLEELDRKLEELDRETDEELESIEPLEDVNLNHGNRSNKQAQSRKRRRGALPRRTNRLRR